MKNQSQAVFFSGVPSSFLEVAPSVCYFLDVRFLSLPIFPLTGCLLALHASVSFSPCPSLFPFLSLGILFTVFDLGIPFLPEQTKQPQTSLNCNPQCTHTLTHRHTYTHHIYTLSLLLITHRKWAHMQTRPAWPVEPRMEFQAMKCSPVEEIEHDLSLPHTFILLHSPSCFTL